MRKGDRHLFGSCPLFPHHLDAEHSLPGRRLLSFSPGCLYPHAPLALGPTRTYPEHAALDRRRRQWSSRRPDFPAARPPPQTKLTEIRLCCVHCVVLTFVSAADRCRHRSYWSRPPAVGLVSGTDSLRIEPQRHQLFVNVPSSHSERAALAAIAFEPKRSVQPHRSFLRHGNR